MPPARPSRRAVSPDDPEAGVPPNQLPSQWSRIEASLRAHDARVVDADKIAKLVNQRRVTMGALRRGRLAATIDNVLPPMDEARQFADALGITTEDQTLVIRASTKTAHVKQVTRLPALALQYGIVPRLSNTTARAVGSGLVTLGNALGTALLTMPVNAASAMTMARSAPTIKLDGVHQKDRLGRQAHALQKQVAALKEAETRLNAVLAPLTEPGAERSADVMTACMAGATPADREALTKALDDVKEAGLATLEGMQGLSMTYHNIKRQGRGQQVQSLVRTLRPFLSLLPQWLGPGDHRAQLLSSTAANNVGLGLVVGNVVVQMLWASTVDQRRKGELRNVLNLAYAKLLTESGQAKASRGEPLTANDVDVARCRALIISPAKAMIDRARKQMEAEEAARPGAAPAHGTDAPSSPPTRVKHLVEDAALRPWTSELFRTELANAGDWQEFGRELTVGLCRIFHMLVLGSAGTLTLPRAAAAYYGSNAAIPWQLLMALTMFSLLASLATAWTDDVSLSYKLTRETEPPEQRPALPVDILRSLFAMAVKFHENRSAHDAFSAGHDALTLGSFQFVCEVLNPQNSGADMDSAPAEIDPEMRELIEKAWINQGLHGRAGRRVPCRILAPIFQLRREHESIWECGSEAA
jgi:hypothetical protein